MVTINELLAAQAEDQVFCEVVQRMVNEFGVTHFAEDDQADNLGAVLGGLTSCSAETVVFAQEDYTVYASENAPGFYRLCQADMGGSYNLYFWR